MVERVSYEGDDLGGRAGLLAKDDVEAFVVEMSVGESAEDDYGKAAVDGTDPANEIEATDAGKQVISYDDGDRVLMAVIVGCSDEGQGVFRARIHDYFKACGVENGCPDPQLQVVVFYQQDLAQRIVPGQWL